MASDITAPRRVIRSASQRGTKPPCNGKSALPALRAIRFPVFSVHKQVECSCFVLWPTSRGNKGKWSNFLEQDGRSKGPQYQSPVREQYAGFPAIQSTIGFDK